MRTSLDVRELTMLAQCPRKWYWQSQCGLRKRGPSARELFRRAYRQVILTAISDHTYTFSDIDGIVWELWPAFEDQSKQERFGESDPELEGMEEALTKVAFTYISWLLESDYDLDTVIVEPKLEWQVGGQYPWLWLSGSVDLWFPSSEDFKAEAVMVSCRSAKPKEDKFKSVWQAAMHHLLSHALSADGEGFSFCRHVAKESPPKEPRRLKSGELSKDRRQNTTLASYLAEMEHDGIALDDPAYADVLAALEQNVFVWTTCHEDLDVLAPYYETHVFPSLIQQAFQYERRSPIIHNWACASCPFYPLCEAATKGESVEPHLVNYMRSV